MRCGVLRSNGKNVVEQASFIFGCFIPTFYSFELIQNEFEIKLFIVRNRSRDLSGTATSTVLLPKLSLSFNVYALFIVTEER